MTRQRGLAALLLAPALLLVCGVLILPLLVDLATAIRDPELAATLPRTAALLGEWDGRDLPPEPVYAAAAQEIAQAVAAQRIGGLAQRLNFQRSGLRALLLKTARADLAPPYRDAMTALDTRWKERATWLLLRGARGPFTALYLLRALDLDLTPQGAVAPVPPDQAIFRTLFARTLWMSVVTTLLCLLIGYPVAATLAALRPRWARVGIGLVLVPFWISTLVRATAWLILLQREGPVNDALQSLGIASAPLQLIFTRFAVYLAMVHVLLPFVVLPLYGVMRRIDPGLLRAATSLGAPGWMSFVFIYLPLTLPGIAAGALIAFMLSVGYYVTPALVGGPTDQMVSAFIASYADETLNWGMAAALAFWLLLMTAVVVASVRLLLPLPRFALAGRS
jgi:putative spermidine/putrescine transport system permease protein